MAAERYEKGDPVNLGSGEEIRIGELVYMIRELVGYDGEVEWDTTRPDGQERRKLDVSRAKEEFGFESEIPLMEGLVETIEWYKKNIRRVSALVNIRVLTSGSYKSGIIIRG
jgi:nucleoside-diphosphate-sugar epimerase